MSRHLILSRLRRGPATNEQLQEIACDHSGGIARTMSKLMHQGLAHRIDGKRGRGTRALYAIKDER